MVEIDLEPGGTDLLSGKLTAEVEITDGTVLSASQRFPPGSPQKAAGTATISLPSSPTAPVASTSRPRVGRGSMRPRCCAGTSPVGRRLRLEGDDRAEHGEEQAVVRHGGGNSSTARSGRWYANSSTRTSTPRS